jgi:protein ImuB
MCLWFPRLPVEHLVREIKEDEERPMALVRDVGNSQLLYSLNAAAELQGLQQGQPLRDAMAMCPNMVTRLANVQEDARFLTKLRRWAGKFSPWIAEDLPWGLTLDISGCAHLFDGELNMVRQIEGECAALRLTVCIGVADTVGAAWGLARFSGQQARPIRSGDAIDQEAYATRSRAAKRRHWERGGAAPKIATSNVLQARIAPHGATRQAIGKLPLPALRLTEADVSALAKLGLRRIEDVIGVPRATLARRFGRNLIQRLDQALGLEPEPVASERPDVYFSTRLTFPEPIGLKDDILAGANRMLPPLCDKLRLNGRGMRLIRLQIFRTDETSQSIDVGLARPSHDPARVIPLLTMKLDELDVGFGIDVMRLEVRAHETVQATQHTGHVEAKTRAVSGSNGLEDLIARIGARIGLDEIIWMHPSSSHIPEKAMMVMAAAWAEPVNLWPDGSSLRPLTIFPSEPVTAENHPFPPETFKWRGRELTRKLAVGPERISPEWWLDEPAWRTGVRDYWRVEIKGGETLWMYFAHGAGMTGGWFCHGNFG